MPGSESLPQSRGSWTLVQLERISMKSVNSPKEGATKETRILLESQEYSLRGRPVFYQWIGEIPLWYKNLREITSSHTAATSTTRPKIENRPFHISDKKNQQKSLRGHVEE